VIGTILYIISVVIAVGFVLWVFYDIAKTEAIPVSVFLGGLLMLAVCFLPVANVFLTLLLFSVTYGDDFFEWVANAPIWSKVVFGPLKKD
jgi:hypothetical protein